MGEKWLLAFKRAACMAMAPQLYICKKSKGKFMDLVGARHKAGSTIKKKSFGFVSSGPSSHSISHFTESKSIMWDHSKQMVFTGTDACILNILYGI